MNGAPGRSRDIAAGAAAAVWDCHVHVFEPGWPLARLRAYTPEPAPVAALADHLARVGADHAVLVQASPHGDDNAGLLAALERLGPLHRAVVAPAPGLDAAGLRALRARGVRGLRLNPLGRIEAVDGATRAALARLGRLAADAGLSLEVGASVGALALLEPDLAALPCPVVLPHLADLAAPQVDAATRERLVAMLARRGAWVKLSGFDRYPAEGAGEVARLLLAALPDRLVWGSDWPHTPFHDGRPVADDRPSPARAVDAGAARARIAALLGGEGADQVFAKNALALYG